MARDDDSPGAGKSETLTCLPAFPKYNTFLVAGEPISGSTVTTVEISGSREHFQVKQLLENIHLVHCKNQLTIHFRQPIKVKGGRNWQVILPLLAKYNQRKLLRVARLAGQLPGLTFSEIIKGLLEIENYLEVSSLTGFFSVSRATAEEILIEMEAANLVKIISLLFLQITSREHCHKMREILQEEISGLAAQRMKSVKISDFEKAMKIPHSSVFFRYLLSSLQEGHGFSRQNNVLVFHKVIPAPEILETIPLIEKNLKKNKLAVFTIPDIVKICELNPKTVNDALWYMVENDKVLTLNESTFAFSDEVAKILNRLKKFKRNQGELIDIQSFREISTFNRKTIITFLEYLDSQNITQRQGNKRRILLPT